jgi:hypothetical protein
MVNVSVCGWFLSVLRGPKGSGVYPLQSVTISSNCHVTPKQDVQTVSDISRDSKTTPTIGTSRSDIPTTREIRTDNYLDSCQIHSEREMMSRSHYSIETSCQILKCNGLDTSLGDLLFLTKEAGVDAIVSHLGLRTFADRVRATAQLKLLLEKYVQSYYTEKI